MRIAKRTADQVPGYIISYVYINLEYHNTILCCAIGKLMLPAVTSSGRQAVGMVQKVGIFIEK